MASCVFLPTSQTVHRGGLPKSLGRYWVSPDYLCLETCVDGPIDSEDSSSECTAFEK